MVEPPRPRHMLTHLVQTLWSPSGNLMETVALDHKLFPVWERFNGALGPRGYEGGHTDERVILYEPVEARVTSTSNNEPMAINDAHLIPMMLSVSDKGMALYGWALQFADQAGYSRYLSNREAWRQWRADHDR